MSYDCIGEMYHFSHLGDDVVIIDFDNDNDSYKVVSSLGKTSKYNSEEIHNITNASEFFGKVRPATVTTLKALVGQIELINKAFETNEEVRKIVGVSPSSEYRHSLIDYTVVALEAIKNSIREQKSVLTGNPINN